MSCWSIPDIFKIIDLYRKYPCLWEFQSPEYKRVDLKTNAWEEISREMDKSVEEVKKKIKHLRSAYVSEKKKADESKSSGSSSDDVYRPHLFYYNELSFLDTVIVLRKTSNSLYKESGHEVEICPEEFESIQFSQGSCFSARSTPASPVSNVEVVRKGAKKCKIENVNKFDSAIEELITKINYEEDETMFTTFCKSIAMQLAQLPLADATCTMAAIQKLLAEKVANCSKRSMIEAAISNADISYEEILKTLLLMKK